MQAAILGELVGAVLDSWPWRCRCRRAGRLIIPNPTQVQIQIFELTHANIYLICELLEGVKGPALQI